MFEATTAKTAERQCNWWNSRNAGNEAMTAICDGYRCGIIERRTLKAHRVIWALVHDAWPEGDIDHINGDRADNRLRNLRSVDRRENCRNRAVGNLNTSGIVGVFWSKRQKRWGAHIGIGARVTKHLGWFKDKADAAAARKAAERNLGFHENHGRPV
jgi:hypothetical protein